MSSVPAPHKTPDEPKPTGRPPIVPTEDIQRTICGMLAEGKSINEITDPKGKYRRKYGLPAKGTIYNWLSKGAAQDAEPLYRGFLDRYVRVREVQGDLAYDEILEIERCVRLPEDHPNYLDPQKARVLIDSIKWRASKLKPKSYGERLDVSGTIEHKHKLVDEAPGWMGQTLTDQRIAPTLDADAIDVTEDQKGEDKSKAETE